MIQYLDMNNEVHEPKANEEIIRRISVYAFIQSVEGKILTVVTRFNNKYGLPGGGVESTENILDGLRRECQEETGCEVELLNSQPIFCSESRFYDKGKFYNSLNLFFPARLLDQTKNENLTKGYEVVGNEWKNLSDLDESNLFNNLFAFANYLKGK